MKFVSAFYFEKPDQKSDRKSGGPLLYKSIVNYAQRWRVYFLCILFDLTCIKRDVYLRMGSLPKWKLDLFWSPISPIFEVHTGSVRLLIFDNRSNTPRVFRRIHGTKKYWFSIFSICTPWNRHKRDYKPIFRHFLRCPIFGPIFQVLRFLLKMPSSAWYTRVFSEYGKDTLSYFWKLKIKNRTKKVLEYQGFLHFCQIILFFIISPYIRVQRRPSLFDL